MPTSVSIGPVDYNAKYAQSPNAAIWTDYKVFNRYFDDPSVVMMGLSSPSGFNGQSVGFAQMFAKTTIWVCDWTACRYFEQPKIPPTAPTDPNWVFMFALPEAASLGLAADGATPLYRISGVYVYGCKNPAANVFDLVRYPRPPWMQDAFTRTVPSSAFEGGIIDGTGGGAGQASPGVPLFPQQGQIRFS